MANTLPVELVEIIASHVHTLSDHVALSHTCRRFRSIYTESFWLGTLHRHGLSRSLVHADLSFAHLARSIVVHASACLVCQDALDIHAGNTDLAILASDTADSPVLHPVFEPLDKHNVPRLATTAGSRLLQPWVTMLMRTGWNPEAPPQPGLKHPLSAHSEFGSGGQDSVNRYNLFEARYTITARKPLLSDHITVASLLATTSLTSSLVAVSQPRFVPLGIPRPTSTRISNEVGITVSDLMQAAKILDWMLGNPYCQYAGAGVRKGGVDMIWEPGF